MVATTSFIHRHKLMRANSDTSVDKAVLHCLPTGTKVEAVVPCGASAWTVTSNINTIALDGSPKASFLKISQENGPIMMEGEYNSLRAIALVNPNVVPKVYGWGKLSTEETWFLVMDFIDLERTMPDPSRFCEVLADLPKNSVSPTGKFGFPVPNCHGKYVQPNDWGESWCSYFSRLVTIHSETDLRVYGPWQKYQETFELLKGQIIPTLLEPLQADGRMLKPCLTHGDLWEENTGINLETGQPIFYESSAFFAHNEYELGMWRSDYIRFEQAYFEQYLQRFPASDPAKQWNDRNVLYSIDFALGHSSHWPETTDTREKILENMSFLIQKYSLGQTEKAAAVAQCSSTTASFDELASEHVATALAEEPKAAA